MKITETPTDKYVRSEFYNYDFNKQTGLFMRWGKTINDDPEYSQWGPEIVDMEVSTVCSKGCSHCYKSNISKGTNMSLRTFKRVFNKLPKTVTQIAFGIGDIDANPDLWKIMKYCLMNGVIPNITINGARMTADLYDKLEQHCGAVAVSLYDYDECYNAVKELTDRGMTQVNIHCLLSDETFGRCATVLHDKLYKLHNNKLEKLNAIVFLWLKPKGCRNTYHQVNKKEYENLVKFALDNKISIGFDSCSAPMFLEAIKEHKDYQTMYQHVEPCESTLFSTYINVDGKVFPCSFSENVKGYKGIDLLKIKDFNDDVWFHPETKRFREVVTNSKDLNGCRNCPLYELGCVKNIDNIKLKSVSLTKDGIQPTFEIKEGDVIDNGETIANVFDIIDNLKPTKKAREVNIIYKAKSFAMKKHKDQFDDDNLPYVLHPMQVGHLVSLITSLVKPF